MEKYRETSIYISAYAKLPTEMPSAELYKSLDMGLVIDSQTGEILDAAITLVTEETKKFLKGILVGESLGEKGMEPIIEEIKARYFGTSQKAICVTLKLIYEKYLNLLKMK